MYEETEADEERDQRDGSEVSVDQACGCGWIGRRRSSTFAIFSHSTAEKIVEGLIVVWRSPAEERGKTRVRGAEGDIGAYQSDSLAVDDRR